MKTSPNSFSSLALGIASMLAWSAPAAGQVWAAGPTMTNARHASGVVQHGGDVYAIGGFGAPNSLEVLPAGALSWSSLAALPTGQSGLCAAVVGNDIFTFGSYGPSNICQVYDIPTDTWSAGPALPAALYWSTAEAVGTQIFVIGGFQALGAGPLDTVHILDTTTMTWSAGAAMPGAIQVPASAVVGNSIFVFGSGSNYVYDVPGDSWSNFTGPPSGHGSAAEAVAVGNDIYLIGGSPGSIYTVYRSTEIYDTVTDSWTRGPGMVRGRQHFGAVYVPREGAIYAVGGRDNTAMAMREVERLPLFRACCIFRNGTGVNPSDYSCVTAPRIGAIWLADISTTATTIGTYIVLGGPPVLVPLFGGEALVIPTGGLLPSVAGSFAVPIPNDPILLGLSLPTQGLRLDSLAGVELLNAQDLVFGF